MCEECRSMKLGTLCYIEKDGKVLLLHRVKKENDIHEGNWIGLGGKIEEGESPEECIIREVREESGLLIQNPKLRGIMTFPDFKGDCWQVFLYSGSKFSGELIDSDEGILKWVPKDDLHKYKMSQGDRIFIEWLHKDEKLFTAKFIYEEDELTDYSIKNI